MPLGPHLAKAEGQETQPSPGDSIWLHSHYQNQILLYPHIWSLGRLCS